MRVSSDRQHFWNVEHLNEVFQRRRSCKFLPEDLLVSPTHHEDIPLSSLSFTMCWLATIHPSWISVAIKDFPEVIQRQLLSWLPDSLVQELLPLLPGISIAKQRCSNFGAFYLLDMLSKNPSSRDYRRDISSSFAVQCYAVLFRNDKDDVD